MTAVDVANPRPPSLAYQAVAVHLTDAYFTKPPPDDGMELVVTHRGDNVATRWIFTHRGADMAEIRLRKNPDLRVTRKPWRQRQAAA